MIQPGARGAWRELEAKLRPFVSRRVRTVDVDDVIQDVFVRMQRGLGGLRDDERFGAWVYRVARSAIADHHRAAVRHPSAAGEPPEAEVAGPEDEGGCAARELAEYVAPFVARLPSPYREALTLTELEGLAQKDAAAMLGLAVSGMKSRVQRGRRLLRKALLDCCRIALDARGRVMSCEPRAAGRPPAGCCG